MAVTNETNQRSSANIHGGSNWKMTTKHSLISVIEERDRLTKETGRYYGIETLVNKEKDPIKYERLYSRIHAALIAAYEISRYVTASPGSREMGEILWTLLTPEGDAVAISPGFFSHNNAGQIAIRFMAQHQYEKNPGIRDGDIFVTDDGESGGSPHPGDTYTYVPIIVEGVFIGWAMGVNHIYEAGGPVAGSWPGYAVDTFWDGFVVPPIKTGENLQQYTWWEQMWLRRTRAGVSNNLDDKMRLSGCAMVHKEVHKIVEEFGVDYFLDTVREMIEETRQTVVRNVKLTTIPGRYDRCGFRSVLYEGYLPIAEKANKDSMIHIRQRMVIDRDASVTAYLDGSSHWDYHAYNGYPGGADCAFYMGMINAFGYNAKPNAGVKLNIMAEYPKGSVYNPDTHFASFTNIWGSANVFNSLGFNTVNQSMFMRGFLEEAFVVDGDWEGVQGEGVLPDGTHYAATNFEGVGAIAQGAFCFKDGMPLGWAMWSQLPNVGNGEENEYLAPSTMYIGRKLIPGFCGFGKYRGGQGQGSLHWAVKPGSVTLSRGGAPTAYTTFGAQGMSGAYPAPCSVWISARNTNSYELVNQGVALPRDGIELLEMVEKNQLKVEKLDIWRHDMPPIDFEDGDLLATFNGASSGWGDPLDRAPEAVLGDIKMGMVTKEFARKMFGVEVVSGNDGNLVVNCEATENMREEIRRQRLSNSVPAKQFWQNERKLLLDKEFIKPIKYMYSRTVSEVYDFEREFEEFWQLPDDYMTSLQTKMV